MNIFDNPRLYCSADHSLSMRRKSLFFPLVALLLLSTMVWCAACNKEFKSKGNHRFKCAAYKNSVKAALNIAAGRSDRGVRSSSGAEVSDPSLRGGAHANLICVFSHPLSIILRRRPRPLLHMITVQRRSTRERRRRRRQRLWRYGYLVPFSKRVRLRK